MKSNRIIDVGKRTRFSVVIVLSLFLSGLPKTLSLATTSVSTCSKLGSKSGTKAKPLVCSKVGKSLVWQAANTTTGGKNGSASIKSAKIVLTQVPKRGGQEYLFDFKLTCGKVMSLKGPQRYPEIEVTNFTLNAEKYSTWPMTQVGLPTLSDGGNTATYQFKGVAPHLYDVPIRLMASVKDVEAPTCTGASGQFRTAAFSSYFTINESAIAGDRCFPYSPLIVRSALSSDKDLGCRGEGDIGTVYKIIKNPPAIPVPAGGAPIEQCQLRDGNVAHLTNVGFPRSQSFTDIPLLPSSGVANVQMIAIDFPGSAGTDDVLEFGEDGITHLDNWLKFYTNKQLSFKWQYPKRWFRMPKKLSEYNVVKGNRASNTAIGTDIIAAADPYIDFTNSDLVIVLLPNNEIETFWGIGFHNFEIPSNEGRVKNIWSTGAVLKTNGKYVPDVRMIVSMMHEYLHPMGIAGHAPRGPFLMHGGGSALGVWDAFLAGWLDTTEFYCMPKTVTKFESSLIPLERLQHGMRGIIIPISDTNGLVIESHRDEGEWETKLSGRYGVAVYWVDTTKLLDRYKNGILVPGGDGAYGDDTDEGEVYANYLSPFIDDFRPTSNKRFLLWKGESVTYKGITVKVLESGDTDTVRVTKD